MVDEMKTNIWMQELIRRWSRRPDQSAALCFIAFIEMSCVMHDRQKLCKLGLVIENF